MIKELDRFETRYIDGSFWVKYEEDGRIGYEIVKNKNEKINPKKEKILVENIPFPDLYNLLDIYYKDDAYYIEKYYFKDKKSFEKKVDLAEKTMLKYPILDQYIDIFENEDEIIIISKIITEILF